jgi:lycopene cyclase domain-containing protein
MKYAYLIIDLAVISMPLLASFGSIIRFYKTWPALLKSLAITGGFFIIWDAIFTEIGVWGFNEQYLSGPELWGLPLEEILFFICVPYACTFTYAVFRKVVVNPPLEPFNKLITLLILALCLVLAAFNTDKLYTFYTCLFTAIFLAWIIYSRKTAYLGWFYITYGVILVPFIITNGLLTGLDFWKYPLFLTDPAIVSDQIVWYNNEHNLGIRIFSIPVDDLIYSLLLQGMSIYFYDFFLRSEKK